MLIEMLAAAAVVSGAGQDFAPQIPGGPERVAPRGDYRDSCSGEYVNRGRLYADCRNNRGNIRGTSIELNRCANYEIRNNDGLLVCGPNRGEYEDRPDGGGGGGGRPDRPGGGWGGGATAVTVLRDPGFPRHRRKPGVVPQSGPGQLQLGIGGLPGLGVCFLRRDPGRFGRRKQRAIVPLDARHIARGDQFVPLGEERVVAVVR